MLSDVNTGNIFKAIRILSRPHLNNDFALLYKQTFLKCKRFCGLNLSGIINNSGIYELTQLCSTRIGGRTNVLVRNKTFQVVTHDNII